MFALYFTLTLWISHQTKKLREEVREIRFWILAGLLVFAVSKWIVYRFSMMAVLLYYGELGLELPSLDIIQEYRMKAVRKEFHLE